MRFVVDARYAGPSVSGIGNYVRAVGSRLPDLAPEDTFRFWVRPGTQPIATAPNAEEVRVRPVPAGLATLLWPNRLDSLRADDLFHGPANILGFGLPCPSVVTVHDVMWLTHLEWCQPRPYLRPVSRAYYTTGIVRALRHADKILTVSQASADEIVRVEPRAHCRIVVTPNACESHFREPASRDVARSQAARALDSDEPYFLVVGQNQPSKAHDVAVRAFAEARPAGHRLVLVQRLEPGRGLHRLVRELGIEDRVTFAASLPLPALVAVYQSAVALLQPSLAEGFGLPALEAMASGCPVAASDIPPLREVLGGAGLLSSPGSVSELAANLRRMASEPALLSELGARGLERAKAFSWDRSAALTLEAYRDALARPRRVAA